MTTPIDSLGIPAPGLVADLSALFAQRHDLQTLSIPCHAPPDTDIFVEEVHSGGARAWRNLSHEARELAESYLPAPLRATGMTCVQRTAHFLDLVRAATAPVLIQVAPTARIDDGKGVLATAILNPTRPDGTPGHRDHAIALIKDPAPGGQAWLTAATTKQGLSLEQFQELIYKAGHVVAHPTDWPNDTAVLAKRLGLNGLDGLTSLLGASPGVELVGDAEESVTMDAATGATSRVSHDIRKTRTPLPTAVVIQWEPLPGLSLPVLLRVYFRRARDGGDPTWHLQALDLDEQGRRASELLSDLLTFELAAFEPGARVIIGSGQKVSSS